MITVKPGATLILPAGIPVSYALPWADWFDPLGASGDGGDIGVTSDLPAVRVALEQHATSQRLTILSLMGVDAGRAGTVCVTLWPRVGAAVEVELTVRVVESTTAAGTEAPAEDLSVRAWRERFEHA